MIFCRSAECELVFYQPQVEMGQPQNKSIRLNFQFYIGGANKGQSSSC